MLERATRELDVHPDRFTCRRCQRGDQFVSHGFVYRKLHGGKRCVVGKRVFCADRRGRRGCGATLRLRLAEVVPRLHVGACVLQGFVLAVLAGSGVAAAYLQATAAQSPRQGWRWVKRLVVSHIPTARSRRSLPHSDQRPACCVRRDFGRCDFWRGGCRGGLGARMPLRSRPPPGLECAVSVFFDSLESLERATRELDVHPDRFTCCRCLRGDQFVSHGFVYRKLHGGKRCVVGKRVFCADRRGRRGCGATLRLRLVEVVPRLHVGACVLQGFVLALLAGSGVAAAYLQATAAQSSRQGWRWVKRLRDGLVHWRIHLPRSISPLRPLFAARLQRMQVLLTSLSALALHFGERFVVRFQADLQVPFLR